MEVVTKDFGGAAFIAIFQGECTTYNYKKLGLGIAPQNGAWYHIELMLQDSQYTCTVSGGELAHPKVINWTKPTPFADGKAGLWHSSAVGAFRNLVITPL
jgi:hypothetical protein